MHTIVHRGRFFFEIDGRSTRYNCIKIVSLNVFATRHTLNRHWTAIQNRRTEGRVRNHPIEPFALRVTVLNVKDRRVLNDISLLSLGSHSMIFKVIGIMPHASRAQVP